MVDKKIFNKDLALFVGAGASIAAPSCLPSFYRMRDFIMETLLQNVPQVKKEYYLGVQTKPELLLQILWEYFGNQLNPIKGFENAPANLNHYIISNICKKGVRFIITTNFDRCIEKALIDSNISYKVFYKSPSNQSELDELKYLINDNNCIVIWKPHGDCIHNDTLCYTIEQVARLNVSKYLKQIYEFVLNRFNLLTLGYSGYDDDLFPILLDFPKTNKVKNRIYWNAYSKIQPNTPPYHLQKKWKSNFQILEGDMQLVLSDFKDEYILTKISKTESGQKLWEQGVKSEILKLSSDWTITVLGQYFNRLQLYSQSFELWEIGLECKNINEINKLRFELNSLKYDDLIKLREICTKSYKLGEYKILSISLIRMIHCLIGMQLYDDARKYLKDYKNMIAKYPSYFTYPLYIQHVNIYLDAKYKGNDRKINNFRQKLILFGYEKSKLNGNIIEAVELLNSYIASIAVDNRQDSAIFQQILSYIPILEAYNIPTNLAGLYFSIAMYASRINDNKLGLNYINLCLDKLESCYENRIYDSNRYAELKAYILHQKSMFGTMKQAIELCEEAIKQINSIEDFKDIEKCREYYLGVYYSSISANYLGLKKYKKAKEYAEIALLNHVQAADERGEARTLITYGELLLIEGEKNKSIATFQKSYQKCIAVGENTIKLEVTLKRLHLEIL